eukprot:TRINITY_DN101350_c0_g1_i1.p1 TRINITY_DN101350_c0_g1~~TRINITY_DN101350_c0_g1_i1.p1  ORF type:complete len:388 (+),score=68.41 TRINITY_DN101350_c0_g1_i1:123-1286(+)
MVVWCSEKSACVSGLRPFNSDNEGDAAVQQQFLSETVDTNSDAPIKSPVKPQIEDLRLCTCSGWCYNGSGPGDMQDAAVPPVLADLGGEMNVNMPRVSDGVSVIQTPVLGAGKRGDEDEELTLVEKPEMSIGEGLTYAGQWRGSQPHGQGRLCAGSNSVYEGDFWNSMAHGFGTLTVKTEGGKTYQYRGEWYHDEKSGRGMELWADGSQYKGQYAKGKQHGEGTFIVGDKVLYHGQFAAGDMDGEGTFSFPDGRVYSGGWTVGHMSGFGVMEWNDGSTYRGNFVKDLRHGDGSYTWPDGREYKGQWVDDAMDGEGFIIDKNRQQTKVSWKEGKQVIEAGQLLAAPTYSRASSEDEEDIPSPTSSRSMTMKKKVSFNTIMSHNGKPAS